MERESIDRLDKLRLRPRLDEIESRRRGLRHTVIGGVLLDGTGPSSGARAARPVALRAAPPRGGEPSVLRPRLRTLPRAGVVGYVNFRARYKREIVSEIVRALPPGARYFPDRHIPREAYDASGLFRTDLSVFRGDDLLQGRIGETPYDACELEASYSSGKRTSIVFRGLFARVDLDRDLRGRTILKPADQAPPEPDEAGLQRVALADPAFDAVFSTWSTDTGEAQGLLDDGTRQRLLDLHARVGRPLHLSFAGRVATVAVHYGRRLFEPRVATQVDRDAVGEMAAQLGLTEDIVRALGLDGQRGRAADPAFLVSPTTVSELEAVVARAGDVDLADLSQAVEEHRPAASLPAPPLGREPLGRFSQLGGETVVDYPVTIGIVFWVLLFLALSAVVLVLAARWASPAFAGEVARAVVEYPTAFLLGSLASWWLAGSVLPHRPASVTVGVEGVRIRRVFRPWAFSLPLAVVLLRGLVMASPLLSDDQEARWLAHELQEALRRSGWAPPDPRRTLA